MIDTTAEIEGARGLLAETPDRPASPLKTLGAAALAAFAAVLMAGVMVLGPGFVLKEPPPVSEFAPGQFEN